MADKKDPMVDFVVEEFKRYEMSHREEFDRATTSYEAWMNKPPRRSYEWQNAVHVPVTIKAEQTITPRIHSAIFPTPDPVEVKVFNQAPEMAGLKIRSQIRHDFVRSNIQGEAFPSLTQTVLYGTGYMEAGWKVQWKWIEDNDGERTQRRTANYNDCNFVNFFEIFPHPAKLKMDDGLPLIRRRFCDAEYLKALGDNKRFETNNLQKALASKSPATYINVRDENDKVTQYKQRERYEILEYWGPWDESYKKENGDVVNRKAVPYWIIVINREVKLRAIPNPFNFQHPPFAKITFYENAKPSWFGIGIGTAGQPTQERINKIVNQRLDNVDLVLNKQGFYNGNDILINTKKLRVSQPGQWHKVSDTVTSIRWMDTPDVTASSYKEEEIAKNDYMEATGATIPLMPSQEGQHRTAMGISLLQGAAGARFKPILTKIEYELIHEVAMMYFSNLQQFMVVPEQVLAQMPDGSEQVIQVAPVDIQAQAHFIPMGVTETLQKEVQIGQLMRFKELTVNDPTVNRQEINKRIAELMGFKDVQKLLTPMQQQTQPGGLPPQLQQRIQQRRAEGASPEQIKLELLGQPPAEDQQQQQQQPAGVG